MLAARYNRSEHRLHSNGGRPLYSNQVLSGMRIALVVLFLVVVGLTLNGCAVNVVVAPHAVVDVGYACKAGSDANQ